MRAFLCGLWCWWARWPSLSSSSSVKAGFCRRSGYPHSHHRRQSIHSLAALQTHTRIHKYTNNIYYHHSTWSTFLSESHVIQPLHVISATSPWQLRDSGFAEDLEIPFSREIKTKCWTVRRKKHVFNNFNVVTISGWKIGYKFPLTLWCWKVIKINSNVKNWGSLLN